MREINEVIKEFGLKVDNIADNFGLEEERNKPILFEGIIQLEIVDLMRFKEWIKIPEKYFFIPDVFFENIKVVISLRDGRKKNMHLRNDTWDVIIEKNVEKLIRKEPEKYGLNRSEVKLKEMFEPGKIIKEEAKKVVMVGNIMLKEQVYEGSFDLLWSKVNLPT